MTVNPWETGIRMPDVILFGAGSPVIIDVEETCHRLGWTIRAIIRNVAAPDHASAADLVRPIGDDLRLTRPVVVPLFNPANRRAALEHARSFGARNFPPLIDPTAVLARKMEIGEGVYINAGCTIGAAARLGRFAFVNRGACLGHHITLGEFASIGPGVVAAGQVTVEADAMVGAGAVILPCVSIGAGAHVAAGAVVRRDVAERAIVSGNPARVVGAVRER